MTKEDIIGLLSSAFISNNLIRCRHPSLFILICQKRVCYAFYAKIVVQNFHIQVTCFGSTGCQSDVFRQNRVGVSIRRHKAEFPQKSQRRPTPLPQITRKMDKLLEVTKHIEKQVDAAIERIDNLDANDLENIRRNRVKEMKERDLRRKEWLSNGHGSYDELPEEKAFFDAIKRSERVVLHFYTNTNERSRIVDMHFKALAPRHVETLFTKLNAEKCPFLAERLKIKMIPSIVCVKNGTMVDKLVGFATLGNRDDFSTEDMEWRLAQNEVIEYEGDLSVPPSEQKIKPEKNSKIRTGIFNGHDDDLDVEDVGTTKLTSAYELSAEEAAELGLDE